MFTHFPTFKLPRGVPWEIDRFSVQKHCVLHACPMRHIEKHCVLCMLQPSNYQGGTLGKSTDLEIQNQSVLHASPMRNYKNTLFQAFCIFQISNEDKSINIITTHLQQNSATLNLFECCMCCHTFIGSTVGDTWQFDRFRVPNHCVLHASPMSLMQKHCVLCILHLSNFQGGTLGKSTNVTFQNQCVLHASPMRHIQKQCVLSNFQFSNFQGGTLEKSIDLEFQNTAFYTLLQ